jgi:hypothetical protein
MVAHFWIGEYSGMVWSAALVLAAVLHVAIRAWRGLWRAPVPAGVKLHIALAFANMTAATLFGMVAGVNRMTGWLPWSSMSVAFAHAHLAGVGWAVMMVVGVSYRLIPMIVPAEMPTGRSLARSAVLLQAGAIVLVVGILGPAWWSTAGAALVLAGLGAFVAEVRGIVRRKLPAPPALRRPDWATWQTHVAFVWLLVAAAAGLILTLPIGPAWTITLGWIYGTAGLVGFLAQIVVGIQGRLVPMYAWFRGMEAAGMQPPPRSAHALAHHGLARVILLAWTGGVPLLLVGLSARLDWITAAGGAVLLAAVGLNVLQGAIVLEGARRPLDGPAASERP